ncbi:MAG: hypothetical protein KIS86_04575 [Devosia sp.]|nr:hypothetical protein [Devosia sp.]
MNFIMSMLRKPAPTWWERDGARFIEVYGYSVIDSLLALLAGTVVIAAAIAVMAVMP